MPQKIINIGAQPNDHTGDPLREAYDKINQNFTEIYGMLSEPLKNLGHEMYVHASTAGNIAIDLTLPLYQKINANGAITLSTVNGTGAAARKVSVIIKNITGSEIALSFHPDIIFVGIKPDSLAAGKVCVINFTSTGGAESDTIAVHVPQI